MTFNELRDKYEAIFFEKYEYIENDKNINIYFYYTLGDYHFTHTIVIPKKEVFAINNMVEKDAFLFNLGVMEIINYYKLACPKKIILKAGALRDEQMTFFKKLFYNELKSFREINKIDISEDDFFTFENYSKKYPVKSRKNDYSGNIIPIIDDKNTVVTLKLVEEGKIYLVVNPTEIVDKENTIEVYRKSDPQINDERFLKGDLPISVTLSFLSIFCALLTNSENVILSYDAEEEEYSKTMYFEKDFVAYVEKYITPGIHYFSLLYGMSKEDLEKLYLSEGTGCQ
ncbi:MAG: hypothetical protein IJS47_05660 [Clostridia bacterium]|nr:hypothetical protein [Clostridia bacterium]